MRDAERGEAGCVVRLKPIELGAMNHPHAHVCADEAGSVRR
jgi:hypothetical protein